MKKFFSENSSAFTKYITNQIVMSVLGIMVGLAVLSAEGGNESGMSLLSAIAAVFCVGFLCFLQYDHMFFAGARDAIKAKGNGCLPDRGRGTVIALICSSPIVIVAVVTTVLKLVGNDDATAVSLIIYYALQGSYISLYSIQGTIGVIGYVFVCIIPGIVSAGLGYYLGTKDLPIRKALGFKIKPPYDGPVEKRRDYRERGGSDKE